MRYPVSAKLEIIQLVESSHLPVPRILEKLGIPAVTFYRWRDCDRPLAKPESTRIWSRGPGSKNRCDLDRLTRTTPPRQEARVPRAIRETRHPRLKDKKIDPRPQLG